MDAEQVFSLVQKAQLKQQQQNQETQKDNQEALEERNRKIEKGAAMVHIPYHAVALIVGEFKEDTSDMMTDYFAHTTTKIIYLAYSTHQKDLFPEMRKAAGNSEDIRDLVEAPKDWEHREKYSMGSGYYLGEKHHSGWEVRKIKFDPTNQDQCKDLFIAAAEGRYFCEADEQPMEDKKTSNDISVLP